MYDVLINEGFVSRKLQNLRIKSFIDILDVVLWENMYRKRPYAHKRNSAFMRVEYLM